MKTLKSLAVLLTLSLTLAAQKPTPLTVQTFTNFTYTDVEPAYNYNLIPPVEADILSENPNDYTPEYSNRYFMSIFGPRHKSVSTSNIGYFDFHKGTDITNTVSVGNTDYDEDNPPPIQCMCDGEIYEIFEGPNAESTGTGKYVTVMCDQTFQANPSWGNVYIAYRHLGTIENGLQEGARIDQGDIVGLMGESGHTSTVHLHLSAIRRNTGSQINVHPMRIFNPTAHSHLLNYLTEAEITQLSTSSTEALFRIAVPYNMANFRALSVKLDGGNYEKIYDFEAIGEFPEEDRDDNDIVDGLELFAYPFNRGHHAYRRVWDRYEENKIPDVYPASPESDDFVPFLSEGLYQTPAYVMDLRVKDLPLGFDPADLEIELIDIYGYGVKANGTSQLEGHQAWSLIDSQNNDAEEYQSGTVSTSDGDLELVYDGSSKGNQTVGLRFEDIQIPQGVTIESAFLQFRADNSHDGNSDLTIKGEDVSNSQAFSSSSNNISNRTTTYASTHWNPGAWVKDDMDNAQKWTGLEVIVQELVNRQDWTEDSPMTFIITGTGRREAEAYDYNDLWKNVYLVVNYNDNAAPPSNEPPSVELISPVHEEKFQGLDAVSIMTTAIDPDDNLESVIFYVNDVEVGSVNVAPYDFDWSPSDYGLYDIHVKAVDTEGEFALSETATISFYENSFSAAINHGDNDVEQLENGTIWKNNSDLEFGYDGYVSNSQGLVGHQHVGLRYENVSIPQGAIITQAYVQFTADETDDEDVFLTIWGNDADDAAAFSYTDFDLSTRAATTAQVPWTPSPWETVGAATANERTPDLSSIIQEIVDRPGWSSSNSVVIIAKGDEIEEFSRTAESYNGSPSKAPVLYVEYTLPSAARSAVSNETSIQDIQLSKLSANVYPNPVSIDLIYVDLFSDLEAVAQVQLINEMGQQVSHSQINLEIKNQMEIPIHDLPAGMYWVVIDAGKEKVRKKVVVVD